MNEAPERNDGVQSNGAPFDFSAYPEDTLFHERRDSRDRRHSPKAAINPPTTPNPGSDGQQARPASERRVKKERRRRIDPTTFEKQYTDDEMEFMNAMQRFKVQTGKSFPSHGEVLRIALQLGYYKPEPSDDPDSSDASSGDGDDRGAMEHLDPGEDCLPGEPDRIG